MPNQMMIIQRSSQQQAARIACLVPMNTVNGIHLVNPATGAIPSEVKSPAQIGRLRWVVSSNLWGERRCPLLAQSGHGLVRCKCPLLGVKRTWRFALQMSAFDPKRTSPSQLATVEMPS